MICMKERRASVTVAGENSWEARMKNSMAKKTMTRRTIKAAMNRSSLLFRPHPLALVLLLRKEKFAPIFQADPDVFSHRSGRAERPGLFSVQDERRPAGIAAVDNQLLLGFDLERFPRPFDPVPGRISVGENLKPRLLVEAEVEGQALDFFDGQLNSYLPRTGGGR
jgi:hypothetical protein